MKNIYIILAFSLLLNISTYLYAEEMKIAPLDKLINEAMENNPQVKAEYNSWKAAEYKVSRVRTFPDPKLDYAYFGENIETRVGPQEHKYGLSQKVPFPGKLKLKGESQSKLADILKERYEATKREITKQIKFVYYDMFWVEKAIQVTEEEKTILENLEKVAQRKYQSNLTPQQDVIKAQVELSKLIDKLLVFEQNRKGLQAKLNSLLNRKEGSAAESIDTVNPSKFKYSLEELYKIAESSKQELSAAMLNIQRAEYEASLAKLSYFPDFTFGVDYISIGNGTTTRPNDGEDAWMGKVSVNIPIWFNKLKAGVKEKEADLQAAKKNYETIENNVFYEIQDLYFKILSYKDIISLYKTALVPQAEQAFEAARTGYETEMVDFLNWLDAERVLLQTRLAYYKTIVDYQKSIAYLERVVGKSL